LTSSKISSATACWMGTALIKRYARLTVALPDDEVHHWPLWARGHGIPRGVYERSQWTATRKGGL
jgi:hypothetical protein